MYRHKRTIHKEGQFLKHPYLSDVEIQRSTLPRNNKKEDLGDILKITLTICQDDLTIRKSSIKNCEEPKRKQVLERGKASQQVKEDSMLPDDNNTNEESPLLTTTACTIVQEKLHKGREGKEKRTKKKAPAYLF